MRQVLASLLCAAACSPFASATTTTTTSDASVVGNASDAGAPSDAGDARDGDAPDAGFTPCTVTFCDGFERLTTSASPWDPVSGAPGDNAVIDGVQKHSGGSAFHFTVAANPGPSADHHSFMTKSFTRSSEASLRVEYWFYTAAPYRHSNQMTIELHGGASEQEVSAIEFPTSVQLGTQTYDVSNFRELASSGTPLPKWNHVLVQIDLSQGTAPVSLTVNDAVAVPITGGGVLNQISDVTKIDLTLGPDYTYPGAAYDVWFDDVRFDLK